jgi:predicted enzyme related to lactoylglutathione lyase
MDRVCHFEIPYGDKKRASKFYQDVFGWQIADVPGEAPYTFAITTAVNERFQPTEPGGINGGMYPRGDEGGSKSPVVVIEVKSCEQRLADIAKAGGSKILGPLEIPNMGIYAQVRDSEDNIIGLWQPLAGDGQPDK